MPMSTSLCEWTFRVRLSDVSVKSVSTSADRPLHSNPYFRCDFDGRVMQSETCVLPGDPVWTHKATFDYRLDEDSLTDVVASLEARTVVFQLCFTDGARHVTLGEAAVDLLTLATGSANLQLSLRHNGDVVGTLYAILQMEHLSVVEASVSSLTLQNLPEPLQVQLSYSTLEEQSPPVQSRIAPLSTDPLFESCPVYSVRTSLRVLLGSSLRISFIDITHGGMLIGAVDVPFNEIVTNASGQSVTSFKRNLYADRTYRRGFTAHVVGAIRVANLPCFAQLASGLNCDGKVHGRPLVEGLMLPGTYSKYPSRLPDYSSRSGNMTSPKTRQMDPALGANMPPSGMPITDAQLDDGRHHPLSGGFYHPEIKQSERAPRSSNAEPYGVARTPYSPAYSHISEPLDRDDSYRAVSPPKSQRVMVAGVPSRAAPAPASAGVNRSPMPTDSSSVAPFPPTATLHRAKSPIADVATQLKAQHDDALTAIEAQRRRVAYLSDDLRSRAQSEIEAERKRNDHIAAEDRTLQSRHEATTRNIEELRRLIEEADAEYNNDKRGLTAERAALQSELEDLAATESDLAKLLGELQHHAHDAARIREAARVQVQEAAARLDRDFAALADFESRAAARGARFRGASNPSFYATNATASLTSSNPAPRVAVGMFPTAAAKEQLIDAIACSDNHAFHRALAAAPPDVLHGDNSWLLRACTASSPNEAIVATVLRQRPELLHTVDPASANTALHAACAAQRPSPGVVSLLLQSGANPYAFNVQGLTPFHLALLNAQDEGHQLKRVILAKAGSGVLRQPTANGETGAHLCAVSDRHLPSLRFLDENEADLSQTALVMRDGRPTHATPRDKAVWCGAEADGCRRFLERRGY